MVLHVEYPVLDAAADSLGTFAEEISNLAGSATDIDSDLCDGVGEFVDQLVIGAGDATRSWRLTCGYLGQSGDGLKDEIGDFVAALQGVDNSWRWNHNIPLF